MARLSVTLALHHSFTRLAIHIAAAFSPAIDVRFGWQAATGLTN